ncbi:MAG: 2-hydroxyacid dehydrogenase [Candidatus Njordarchaeia archaeon]
MKPIVYVNFKADPEEKKIFEETIGDLAEIVYGRELENREKHRYIENAEVLITGSGRELNEDFFKKTKKLKFIQTLSAGLDNIPFHAIPKHVIVASNAGGNAKIVAEHALALILSALKNIPKHDRLMRKGTWNRKIQGRMLSGKTVGIVGFGNIGKELAKMLKCFNVKIYAINRTGKTDMDVDYIGKIENLDNVLKNSDIIILALPLTKKTRHLITMRELNMLKKDAIIVNVARGPIIKEEDLYNYLKENPNVTAALDVWWTYPEKPIEKHEQRYPFHKLENVIMTPHIAGFSREITRDVMKHAAENVKRFLIGTKPKNIAKRDDYV